MQGDDGHQKRAPRSFRADYPSNPRPAKNDAGKGIQGHVGADARALDRFGNLKT